ncbi:MAG TPA: DNA topoisomerase III [Marinagarivorans sp.]
MKLYIAEKPSLARALAAALPSATSSAKEDGCITLANGDVVSWCIGHLLELAEPEHYNPDYKKWRLEHLPILPPQWQYQPKAKTRKQLTVLTRLIKRASSIVHVGDPDREGQLLVDEVLNYTGATQSGKSIERCLINDLNAPAIARALNQLKDNREFAPLSASALARSRADWLYGINMTRLCSLKGQQQGFRGVLSVGRVQTPILGLVVARDNAIANFVSKPFYEVFAHLQTANNETFLAKWQPSDACQGYCDDDGRLLSKALAQNVAGRITGQQGVVKAIKKQHKSQPAPLPHCLSSLQVDASKRFGHTAKAVLDICQGLYEKHKLITYPRSDCRYLPLDHHKEAKTVVQAVAHNSQRLSGACTDADLVLKTKAWNDKNVTAHHAIIPTARRLSRTSLTEAEAQVYSLIATQYLAQFYPHHRYDETVVRVKIQTGDFVAKAKCIVDIGWKVLFPSHSKEQKQEQEPQADSKSQIQDFANELPSLKQDQVLLCERGEIVEKQTSPPKAYTDASLITAMTGIARYVQDADIRKILKETDGLGTEATRAGILDLLVQRGFIKRQGKAVLSTEAGRALIASLPLRATTPDMTAEWESKLNGIANQQTSYHAFMASLTEQLPETMKAVEATKLAGVKSAAPKPQRAFKGKRSAGAKPKRRQAPKSRLSTGAS